jgi:hypothetical protein
MADQHLTTSEEIWKPIPGFPGYEVSDHGQVRSYWKIEPFGQGNGTRSVLKNIPQRLKTPSLSAGGYKMVHLMRGGHTNTRTIHRLVLLAFVGSRPDGMQCRHLDGNQLNNHQPNLQWGTCKENSEDRDAHGTTPKGEGHYRAKLSVDQVVLIRQMAINGVVQRIIGEIFGIDRSYVSQIVNRKRWAHIP